MRIAGIVAAITMLIVPLPAFAGDAGPSRDVRGIRGEVPQLFAARLADWNVDPQLLAIDSVVVDGDYAVVQWRAGERSGIDGFVRIFDRWWDRMTTTPCLMTSSPLRKVDSTTLNAGLLGAMGFPAPLVTAATGDLALPVSSGACADPLDSLIPVADADGYAVRMTPSSTSRLFKLSGRKPNEAESWIVPHGDGFFFFYMTSNAPAHVASGSSLDVWFPFLLDPSLRYSLTIAYADKPIGPIDGTLSNNVVHFNLPEFTAPPRVELMCEIDGDNP